MAKIDPVKVNLFLKDNRPTAWAALNHHRTHNNKPLTLQRRPFLKDIYLDNSNDKVVMKSTQCGLSEFLIVYAIMEAAQGRSLFYVLPSYDLVGRFVSNRFSRSVQFTPYYQHLMNDDTVKKRSDGVSLKHIGMGTIAFVGSGTPKPFTEFPADTIIVDELDQCNEANLAMGEERLSASEHKKRVKISNPTLVGFGIDYEFGKSDQRYWHIKCSSCGAFVKPDFFSHVVERVDEGTYALRDTEWQWDTPRDIHMICDKCGKPFNRFNGGEWVKSNPRSLVTGFQVSKLFSANVTIREMVDRFNDGLTNPKKMERFYNGDLGFPFSDSGSKISFKMIADCSEPGYIMPDVSTEPCVMGVDVGNKIHVRISEILPTGKLKAVYIGSVDGYDDIFELYRRYRIVFGVIDSMPEMRLSKKVCATMPTMYRCFYGGKQDSVNPNTKVVTVDRTSSLDRVREKLLTESIHYPENALQIPEYGPQMISSTRVFDEKKGVYEWRHSDADHFLHAENYMWIAYVMYLMAGKGKGG